VEPISYRPPGLSGVSRTYMLTIVKNDEMFSDIGGLAQDMQEQARRFVTAEDKSTLDRWYHERNMPPMSNEFIPAVGFIVKDGAAGFLYMSECDMAYIEGFITPCNISFREREDALNLVTQALVNEAENLGIRKLMVVTEHQGVYNRMIKFNFSDMGEFRIMRLDLNAKTDLLKEVV
jgi:hypothetical protein